jgi:hypothetical protein
MLCTAQMLGNASSIGLSSLRCVSTLLCALVIRPAGIREIGLRFSSAFICVHLWFQSPSS